MPAEPVQVEEVTTAVQEGATDEQKQFTAQEEEPQLRVWPPVAPEGGHREPCDRQNWEPKPDSNIWPPPQAPDYMQSVRELPSKFKTSGDDQTAPPVESEDGKGGHQGRAGTSRQEVTETESYGAPRPPRDPDDQRDDQGQSTGTGVKRRREIGDSGSPRAPSPKRTPVHLDTPVWTQLASEYTYEELGTGESLPIPANLAESTGTPEVGNWGETVVYHYLLKQRDNQDNILEVRWINEGCETGLPYDLEVHYVDHVDYIEVKSTASDSKEVFEISANQVRFAFEKKDHFHIYRVFNAGQPQNVKLIKIDNLDMRMDQKQVRLCMMI